MSAREKYLKILSSVLSAGAVGASLLLAAATPAGAKPDMSSDQAGIGRGGNVAERLAAIRDAVSEVTARGPERGLELAWWAWRNGGGGWRNGGGWGWRNGGWGNGGWRNGGWRNFWRNW